jgi:hypothetical protein
MSREKTLQETKLWPYFTLFLFISAMFFIAHFESAEIKVLCREQIWDTNPHDELYLVHKTYWGLKHETYKMRMSRDGEWQFQTESGSWMEFSGTTYQDMVNMNLGNYKLPDKGNQ